MRERDARALLTERMEIPLAHELRVGELDPAHVRQQAARFELPRQAAKVAVVDGKRRRAVDERLGRTGRSCVPGREAEAGEVHHRGHLRVVRLPDERVVRLVEDVRERERTPEVGEDPAHRRRPDDSRSAALRSSDGLAVRRRSAYDRAMTGTLGNSRLSAAATLFRDLDEAHGRGRGELAAAVLRGRARDVCSGRVRPSSSSFCSGRGASGVGEPVLTSAGPGDTLGELALNGPTVHTATAHALEPVDGLRARRPPTSTSSRLAGDPVAFAVLRRLSLLLAERIRAAGDGASPAAAPAQPQATPGPPVADDAAVPSHAARLPGSSSGRSSSGSPTRCARGTSSPVRPSSRRAAPPTPRSSSCAARSRSPATVATAGFAWRRSGPGRMLGELSLIDGGARTATCAAVEPALVLEIDHDDVDAASGRRLACGARLPAGRQPLVDRRAARDRRSSRNRRRLAGAARRGRGSRAASG